MIYLFGLLDALLVSLDPDGGGALVVVGNVDHDVGLLLELVH